MCHTCGTPGRWAGRLVRWEHWEGGGKAEGLLVYPQPQQRWPVTCQTPEPGTWSQARQVTTVALPPGAISPAPKLPPAMVHRLEMEPPPWLCAWCLAVGPWWGSLSGLHRPSWALGCLHPQHSPLHAQPHPPLLSCPCSSGSHRQWSWATAGLTAFHALNSVRRLHSSIPNFARALVLTMHLLDQVPGPGEGKAAVQFVQSSRKLLRGGNV